MTQSDRGPGELPSITRFRTPSIAGKSRKTRFGWKGAQYSPQHNPVNRGNSIPSLTPRLRTGRIALSGSQEKTGCSTPDAAPHLSADSSAECLFGQPGPFHDSEGDLLDDCI